MKYLIGIQPTGKIHIGNYLGCIKKGIELHKEGNDVTFLIANYHSLTTDNYSDVTEKELIKIGKLHNCDLNIKRQTPEYTEKFFELCCKLNLGTLLKMPQFKDKKEKVEYDLGLLLYPVLMTVDIIINDPDVVIVGKDQVAHLELCNDISKRIGSKKRYEYEFGDVDKIMALKDPEKKMSKSLNEKEILYCFETNYFNKIRRSNTNEKGIENLKKIGMSIGIEVECDSNLELKKNISNRMVEIFG
jgi:tryptophanyl-tRNA synthetase